MKKQAEFQKFMSVWIIGILISFAFIANMEIQAAASEITGFQVLTYQEKSQVSEIDTIFLQENVFSKQQIHFAQNLKNLLAVAFAIVLFPILFIHVFYGLLGRKYTKLWRVVAYIHEIDGKKRFFIM